MSRAIVTTSTTGDGQSESAPGADLPLNHPRMRAYVRDLARGRPGVASELQGAVRVWFPVINAERIPCEEPFRTYREALYAAREFRDRCREELTRED